MKHALAATFALALLATPLPAQEEFTITAERLDALSRELRPVVEKAAGRTFTAAPSLVLSTRRDVEKILGEELVPQMRVLMPDAAPEKRRESAAASASVYAAILLGKYALSGDRVLVVAENFARLAELYKKPRINSPAFLRVVCIHELVHALDEQAWRAMSRVADLKTSGDLSIWNAVIEGHAQHVTRAILAAEKDEALFLEFEEQITADLPGTSEGERLVAKLMTLDIRFAYIEGRRFFDGLAALGKKSYVDDVFKAPPADKDVLLHPERYYDPKARRAARDVAPVWEKLKKLREGWTPAVQKVGEVELRGALGDFVEKKELDAVLSRLVAGQALSVTPADAPGSRLIVVLILQVDGAEGRSRLLDVMERVIKAKDEKMKEGAIRIVKADYGALKTKSADRTFLARKTVAVGAQELVTCDFSAIVGEFVVEILYSNEDATDGELLKVLDCVAEQLRPGK